MFLLLLLFFFSIKLIFVQSSLALITLILSGYSRNLLSMLAAVSLEISPVASLITLVLNPFLAASIAVDPTQKSYARPQMNTSVTFSSLKYSSKPVFSPSAPNPLYESMSV